MQKRGVLIVGLLTGLVVVAGLWLVPGDDDQSQPEAVPVHGDQDPGSLPDAVSVQQPVEGDSQDGDQPRDFAAEEAALRAAEVAGQAELAASREELPENPTPLMRLVDKRFDDRVDRDIAYQIPRVTKEADIVAVRAVVRDPADDPNARNEAMNLLRRSAVTTLIDDLHALLVDDQETPVMRAYAAQQLAFAYEDAGFEGQQERILATLRAAFTDAQDLVVRREACAGLMAIEDQALTNLLVGDAVFDRPEFTGMVDLAIHGVGQVDNKAMLPAVRRLAVSEDEVIAIAAIAVLGAWRDKPSYEFLRQLTGAPSLRLRNAAEVAMARIAMPGGH